MIQLKMSNTPNTKPIHSHLECEIQRFGCFRKGRIMDDLKVSIHRYIAHTPSCWHFYARCDAFVMRGPLLPCIHRICRPVNEFTSYTPLSLTPPTRRKTSLGDDRIRRSVARRNLSFIPNYSFSEVKRNRGRAAT